MKKILISFLSLFLFVGIGISQEDPGKALKKATRALGSFNLDPSGNAAKLTEASEMIEIAISSDELKGQWKTWQTRGKIYNAIAGKEVNALFISTDPSAGVAHPDAPLKASESLNKAFSLAEKKYEKKESIDEIGASSNHLNNLGNHYIQNQDYAGAYPLLNQVLVNHEVLVSNGGESPVKADDMSNHIYVVAVCAQSAEKMDRAKELYKNLYEAGYNEAGVYSKYFQILDAEDDPGALAVLNKGREKFPGNTEIIFTEINYYIQREQYEVLVEKLKQAIEKEPDNPSVYSALGNVYMNLFNQEFTANGNSEKGTEHFNNCLEYYEKALELDDKSFDALYSIGSLYFNNAVEIVKGMAKLGMTKEDQKKYEESKIASDELFKKALPYFKRSESLNANDANTLIALSEIFARTNDFEKSGEFKKRLQVLKDGGQNATSYFSE